MARLFNPRLDGVGGMIPASLRPGIRIGLIFDEGELLTEQDYEAYEAEMNPFEWLLVQRTKDRL